MRNVTVVMRLYVTAFVSCVAVYEQCVATFLSNASAARVLKYAVPIKHFLIESRVKTRGGREKEGERGRKRLIRSS